VWYDAKQGEKGVNGREATRAASKEGHEVNARTWRDILLFLRGFQEV
jgi:hypothetical protein